MITSPSRRLARVTPRTKPPIVVSALVAIVTLGSCANGGGATGAQPAATAGGVAITDAQVAREAKLFTFVSALNQTSCGQAAAGETPEAACNRFALSNLIQGAFIRDYASQHQITVADADVTKIVASLDTQVGKDKVDQLLSSNGLTRDDLTALGAEVLLYQDVQRSLTTSSENDAQLQQLYQQNILEFTTIQADHILVKTKAEAEQVYREVTAPGFTDAQFAALARKVSIDPTAKQNGGTLPAQPASKYVPEFGQAAAALQPGEISQPVQTQYGWHVIKLVSKEVTPFGKAKAQLIQSGGAQIFNDWLMQQAKDRGVDVNPKYGRYDIPTLSVVAITSTDPSATASPSGATGASPLPSVSAAP